MKIFVVNNMVPFVRGGAEELAIHLVQHLEMQGHEVELLRIPFKYDPPDHIYNEMLACRLMQVEEADLVIAMKFPAYLIPHPKKVLWLVHQYRQAYDMWESGSSNIPATSEGDELRRSIAEADSDCFSGVRRLCAISPVIQKRLKKFNGFESELIRTPINSPEAFIEGEYGNYVFCGGRINQTKRQHLLVEAMRHTSSNCKLLIAGPADSKDDSDRITKLIQKYGLSHRVHTDIGFHSREKIAGMMSNSLACAYLPIDEDSLGYVSMEANQAAKAVLTANDSGGLLDLVFHNETGWVCNPNPAELGACLDRIFKNRKATIAMGRNAKNHWLAMGINWAKTVERLVA